MTSNEDEILILDAVDRFLESEVRPRVRALEAADEYPKVIADKIAEMGLFGATISPNYGGLGLSAATYTKIVERISAVWMSVSGLFNSHLIMCAAVEQFGSEEMKSNYLPKFSSGDMRGGIAIMSSTLLIMICRMASFCSSSLPVTCYQQRTRLN